jgi:hypothetical protein
MTQWLGQTNQKLYQARLLIDQLDGLGDSSSTIDNAYALALQDSILFQMVLAYQSYLHEIAEIAQCREEFQSLQQLIQIVPVATGEMTELNQLELDDFSWLSQLMAAFSSCSATENFQLKTANNPSLIQMHETVASSLPLRDWLTALNNIIDLQRNNRQES